MIASRTPASPRVESLWAITSYFNPMRYQRRRENYRVFRQHLNVPLVTVELGYGPDFELREEDADILIRRRGRDVMCQKERLLNVALQALPSTCRKVAWIDCDIIFEADDWSERVSKLLDQFMLVQTFSHAHNLPREWVPSEGPTESEHPRPSVAFSIGSGVPPALCLSYPGGAKLGMGAPGFAWAARREVFDQQGFYDACVVGGGVNALTSAAFGCFDSVMQIHCMNDQQKQHYMAWAQPFCEMIGAEIAFLDGNLFHLWHGELENRRYLERQEGLQSFQFDPFEDIAIDENGSRRWNTHKPEMHEYVRNYFASRKEDG